MATQPTLQDLFTSHSLEAQLRNANPWWRNERQFGIPPFRRWAFDVLQRGVKRPLAPVTVLRGPRQIGKTTLVAQLIDSLLAEGMDARRIFRVQFDDLPELRRLPQPILETKGFDEREEIKKSAAERWVNAVNADGGFGVWAYAIAKKVSDVPVLISSAAH